MSASANLSERLRVRIEREGPITFYEWMKAALYDERDGYYSADRVRQGRTGDYRTAPEISPLFAATFAGYFSKLHTKLSSPPSWTLFEVGAGSGQFALGVLNHLRAHAPQVFDATTYVIDERGERARDRAAQSVSEFADRVSFQRLDQRSEPVTVGIVFSNELIDAFAVHRLVMNAGRLRELCVGTNGTGFTWIECDMEPDVAAYCERIGIRLAEGQIAEVNLEADEFMSQAAQLLDRGYVITVDYGAERDELLGAPDRRSGTLRAFRRHQPVEDVLSWPGEQDLTTTIDWTQIMEAGERSGLRAIRFERLDQFLISEGVLDLIQNEISQSSDAADALRLSTSARELILPTGLAASYQVLVQEKTG